MYMASKSCDRFGFQCCGDRALQQCVIVIWSALIHPPFNTARICEWWQDPSILSCVINYPPNDFEFL
jgi:hypothetical protein